MQVENPRKSFSGTGYQCVDSTSILCVSLFWLGELGFPHIAGFRAIEVLEHKIENFGVPADSMAIDAFFDVLLFELLVNLIVKPAKGCQG